MHTYLLRKKITIPGEGDNATARRADERNKDVIFKNCASFTNCKREINDIKIDNAEDIDIVMPMYNLIEYSKNYSKNVRRLWQYYKEPNDIVADSESFKNLK